MITRYSIIFFAITFGLFIYLIFRQITSPFYVWAVQLGFADEIQNIRNLFSNLYVPEWFIFSLTDGLWMFTFILLMMTICNFNFQGIGKVWTIITVITGISFEICQAFLSDIGTFHCMNMIFKATGALLPILLFTKTIITWT